MAVQKNRKTRSKVGMRRSHHRLSHSHHVSNVALATDAMTGKMHRRHHLSEDGTYRGQQILEDEG